MKRMHSIKLTILIISLFLISCDKYENNNRCNVSNPVEDLEWLKLKIAEINQGDEDLSSYAYFMTATYKGETVFYYGNCNPLINYVSMVQNCNGDTLGNTNDLYSKMSNTTVLWKHKKSKCDFSK